MGYGFRITLTIVFLVKLLSYTEGFYRHPDAEMVPSNDNDGVNFHEQMILEAAVRRGMDPEAVLTVLRTGQPVTKKKTEPNGTTKTTTYSLGPDGTITSKTQIHYVSRHRAPPMPIPSRNNPWLQNPRARPPGRTHVQTFIGPNGERGIVRSWSSGREPVPEPEPEVPETPTLPEENYWPNFNFGPETKPWEPTPEEEDPEWKIFDDDFEEQTTTPKQVKPTTMKTWSWPDLKHMPRTTTPSSTTTTTTTTTSTTTSKPEIEKTTPKLPSLEEFLEQQYGSKGTTTSTTTPATPLTTTSKNEAEEEPEETTPQVTTTNPSTTSSKPENGDNGKEKFENENPSNNPTTSESVTPAFANDNPETTTEKPVQHINVKDLPVNEILFNGQPIDESFFKSLPPELRPQPLPGRTISTEYIPQTLRSALQSDPELLMKLKRAGINPEGVIHVEGNIITNMAVQPTGRAIVTTSRLRPDPPYRDTHTYDFFVPSLSRSYIYSRLQPTYLTRPNNIEQFLMKFDLSKSLIYANRGKIVKKYIDDEGCVLTATFALSQPMGFNGYNPDPYDEANANQPIK
uniref:Uncharacterized protein n=1 Tax=Glossina pallidipes TaxID=7398 RepID=A0A1B0AJI7_GLOPL